MASWWNSKLAKWQVGEMASWHNVILAKQQLGIILFGKMLSQHNAIWKIGKLIKINFCKTASCHNTILTKQHNATLTKWQVGKMASWRHVVAPAKTLSTFSASDIFDTFRLKDPLHSCPTIFQNFRSHPQIFDNKLDRCQLCVYF